jgi:hypothetical protein
MVGAHRHAASEIGLGLAGAGVPRMIRDMIAADILPDYRLEELPGDILRVTPRRVVQAGPGGLAPLPGDTLDAARRLAPGWDVHVLEADWRAVWEASGRKPLRSPDRAFLGWVTKRVKSV